MASKRRFKIGIHPVYDDAFDNGRLDSRLLNSNANQPGAYTVFWDKRTLEALKAQLIGVDGKDEFLNGEGNLTLAEIPAVERDLASIDREFRKLKRQAKMEGRREPELPADLYEKQLRLFAMQDVLEEELQVCNQLLEKYENQEEEEEENSCLAHGLMMQRTLRNGVLDKIDGQKVEMIEGQLVITDKNSCYRGMSIDDYLTLSEEWLQVRKERQQELEQQYLYEIEVKGKSRIVVPSLGTKKINKKSLPPFPKDCKNYLKNETEKTAG